MKRTDTEKLSLRLRRVEQLLHEFDSDDLRPQFMRQILAHGPIYKDSIPRPLADLAEEMSRENFQYAQPVSHRPPKHSDELVLKIAARIMLLSFIEHLDEELDKIKDYGGDGDETKDFDEELAEIDNSTEWLDRAIESIFDRNKGIITMNSAIHQAKANAPTSIRKRSSSEEHLATKFREEKERFVMLAAEEIMEDEVPMVISRPNY